MKQEDYETLVAERDMLAEQVRELRMMKTPRTLAGQLSAAGAPTEEEHADGQYSNHSRRRLLLIISKYPQVTIGTLAERLGYLPKPMVNAVRDLVKNGWVTVVEISPRGFNQGSVVRINDAGRSKL